MTWTLDQRPSPAALRSDVGPPGLPIGRTRSGSSARVGWVEALQGAFGRAANAYLAWGLLLLIALPILF